MSIFEKTPLDRVRAKCEQIEGELKKHPDFQLYLITETIKDRTRMKRLLMKIPNFRLWYLLTNAIAAFETLAPRQESRSIHADTLGPAKRIVVN